MDAISQSLEDYLETVYMLIAEGKPAQVRDVARKLSVKMPSRYRPFEYEIRSRVNKVLQRGKVDMFISYELIGEQNSININEFSKKRI